MVSQQSLLSLLADGEWHSGEALGEAFNISRAAIWKQLQQLQAAGLVVDSERGRGYRLSHPLQLLDSDRIRSGLTASASVLLTALDIEFSIDSTNTRAMQLVESGHSDGQDNSGRVLFAEQQTAGRGRRGRTWISPLASNIYCSLIWRFISGASSLSGLSLSVGVATVQALESLGYQGIELKWPNDLLWQGRKLGGILIEMSGDAAGPCDIVIGIGINLTMSQLNLAQEGGHERTKANERSAIDQNWVDLLEVGRAEIGGSMGGHDIPVDKNAVVSAMLNQLMPMLAEFERQGFVGSLNDWLQRDAFLNRDVVLHLGEKRITGQYVGVASDGSLLIDTADGRQRFNGGEVSLRAARAEQRGN